jgi:hypothetical protein
MQKNTFRNRAVTQLKSLVKGFCHADGLPFKKFLSVERFSEIFDSLVPKCRDRIYPPVVTLSAFISQVLSPDHSCREAVARVIAERVCEGKAACSQDNSPYCRARQRLPEPLLKQLMKETGACLESQSKPQWQWKGRSVKLVDGTTVSMPDTPENQARYPQPDGQKPGLGFPIARLVGVISLAMGSLLDYAIAPYQGKQTGELALLRSILSCFFPGDILLADRYYCSYFLIALLQSMGVDAVFQQHASRKSDFRRGQRLGIKDHLVTWTKPARPDWMDEATYLAMPETLTVREIKAGGKVIVTTLVDPKQATRKELAKLYTQRWLVEVDLRSIKETLQMDVLRCKTPAMVRKEITVHFIAYNLIRSVMAQAAFRAGISPRTISFKGTLQTLNEFRNKIGLVNEEMLPSVFEALINAVTGHRVGHRPGRSEPRAVKRRPKSHPRLTIPRSQVA